MFFDTLCVSFSFVFFKFLVFEAAIYANKDVCKDLYSSPMSVLHSDDKCSK